MSIQGNGNHIQPRITRRQFIRGAGLSAALVVTAGLLQACNTSAPASSGGGPPAATPQAAAAQAAPASSGTVQTLNIALVSWGTETGLPWRGQIAEKPLWDIMHEELILRDQKTFQLQPGLAQSWEHSDDYHSWTFKLRQGVMFHGTWGEFTSDDVKYTVEQSTKPENPGADVPYFRSVLDSVAALDKYTVVMKFKTAAWDVPTHFAQMTGYQNMTSRAYAESVGDDKAALEPVGTGPYRHVDSLQGQFHTFEAVPNHWRVKPGFQRVSIRRILEPTTALYALRAGEVDIVQMGGDNIDLAKQAGFALHEVPGAIMHWLWLPGQTVPGKDDYQPQLTPWADDLSDPTSFERSKQVRLALNLAVNKKAIYDAIYRGYGKDTPFAYWYFPVNNGYTTEWALEQYDPAQAKKILADQNYANGFSISMNTLSAQVDSPDIIEAVAQDWEKVGLTVNRLKEDPATFLPKQRARKTGEVGQLYAPPTPLDEPSLLWQRTMNTRGPLYLLAEGPASDQALDQINAELDPNKRVALSVALATRLVQEHRGIRIGIKSGLWAVSKKVGNWPSLANVAFENNLDLITPA